MRQYWWSCGKMSMLHDLALTFFITQELSCINKSSQLVIIFSLQLTICLFWWSKLYKWCSRFTGLCQNNLRYSLCCIFTCALTFFFYLYNFFYDDINFHWDAFSPLKLICILSQFWKDAWCQMISFRGWLFSFVWKRLMSPSCISKTIIQARFYGFLK